MILYHVIIHVSPDLIRRGCIDYGRYYSNTSIFCSGNRSWDSTFGCFSNSANTVIDGYSGSIQDSFYRFRFHQKAARNH